MNSRIGLKRKKDGYPTSSRIGFLWRKDEGWRKSRLGFTEKKTKKISPPLVHRWRDSQQQNISSSFWLVYNAPPAAFFPWLYPNEDLDSLTSNMVLHRSHDLCKKILIYKSNSLPSYGIWINIASPTYSYSNATLTHLSINEWIYC